MSIIWHNGVLRGNAPVFVAQDRIRLGDGVFDTMLAVDGKPAMPEKHFNRLLEHAEVMGMADLSFTPAVLIKALERLLDKNHYTEGRYAVNTIISRGVGTRGLSLPETPDYNFVMRANPVPDEFPPVEAVIAKTVRRNEGSPLSRIKSCNYGDNILALQEAEEAGGNEAVMLNNKGLVTCATVGNIFVQQGNKLCTPPCSDGVMNGIIRGKILEEHGAEEKSLSAEELENADGLYITNSLRGAMAVDSLNGKKLPAPGFKIDPDIHLA